MCGIVGYIGKNKASGILLDGLKKLEYRGYDSAGMAIADKNKITCLKEVGKVSELEKKVSKNNLKGGIGIAHTRWATHGKPTEKNAHPHSDCAGDIFVVHNGIIENYQELKEWLKKRGHKFKSETDTEVVAHLIEDFSREDNFKQAFVKSLKKIKGTYGLAVISNKNPGKILIAKKGSPLILGVGEDEYLIASDASAIINYTQKVIYLEDGELAEVGENGYRIHDLNEEDVKKKISKLNWSVKKTQKQGFDHFMLKEIFEQPDSLKDAIRGRVDRFTREDSSFILGGLSVVKDRLKEIDRIIIISCGTSYYAGMVGEYMLEEYAEIPTEVEYASEFRYRKPLLDDKTMVVAISQSGETADTLEAIREAKMKGALTIGIVNTVGSTIARETDAGIYNHAGPEIGVASTKAFTSQLSILVLLTLSLARQRRMSFVMGKRIAEELKNIPNLIEKILKKSGDIKKIAEKYKKYNNWLYLGRKYSFPIATEGALKIKEISYVHAEGYPAGEMKHGPIALIDEKFPSLFVCPKDSVYEKVVSGIEEIKARSGKVLVIATEKDREIAKLADDVFFIPKTLEMLTPIISVIPLQLFAYYVGVGKGFDVDKPRNLAKSVTVE
jgi:glucosamine--fructose-6-phosphate aminotransferase (isomerizing)